MLVIALLAISVRSFAQVAADIDLFIALEADVRAARPGLATTRERLVTVERKHLEAARAGVGRTGRATLRLNLFDDAVFDTVFNNSGPTSVGYWLAGHPVGAEPGDVSLVVNGEVIIGTATVAGATYAIRTVGDGVYAIRQLDPAAHPFIEEDWLEPVSPAWPGFDRVQPVHPPTSPTRQVAALEEDGSRIDVMVVYTPAARDGQGGRDEIEALIDLYVAETNQAYANSGVIQRLNLVLATMVDYREADPDRSRNFLAGTVDLGRLVNPNDGFLDEVLDLRDQYAADIVTLVGHYLDQTGGIAAAWCEGGRAGCLPGTPGWTPFNLVDHEVSGSTFAHELGHTMGLNHDRYSVTRCPQCTYPPEQDLRKWKPFPYAFGYVNRRAFEADAPESSRWHTIMAYPSQCADAGFYCPEVLRFSNPDLTFNGDPLGVPGDEPSSSVAGPADARRTLNETRRIIANFRVAPCLRSGTRTSLQANNGQYLTAENGGGGEVLANRDDAGAWEHFTLVDHDGGCLESGDEVSLRTSDGFYLRANLGGGSSLDASGPSAGAWERFTVHRRAGGGAIRSGDFIALEAPDGHYVVATLGGGGAVSAAGTQLEEAWETFKIIVEPPTASSTNNSPRVVGTLADLALHADSAALRVDVSGVFRDPDGDRLTYGATSSEKDVVSVSVSESTITVRAVGAGTSEVTVTATDTEGSNTTATQKFTVRVGEMGLISSRLFVPIVLRSQGRTPGSLFASELTLTNRGSTEATIQYTYSAAFGGGSGTAVDSLGDGEQQVIPDAIAYLTSLGVPIGSVPSGGTLMVDVSSLSSASDAAVTVRVTTPVEEGRGRAGLAYMGLNTTQLLNGPAWLGGLRQTGQDRSNVAVQNAGDTSQGDITLRVTVFSGDSVAPGRSVVVPDRILPPGGFYQYNRILDTAGFENGYVKIERVSGSAPFYAYGVINDNFNSDGSFVFPVTASSLVGTIGQTLPVIIETGNFKSELTLTNFSASDKQLDFSFVADAIANNDDTATFSLSLKAGEQLILPDLVNWLRQQEVEGIGPANREFVGALFATVAEGDMSGIVIGARTGAPDQRGGQYSLFYNGVPYGSATVESAWIYGLQQNADNRSNLALVNTGEIDDSSSTFEITIYDGSGASQPRTKNVVLGSRRWTQKNGILGKIRQGYVQVRKTSGNNPFFAYGVINDGARPGQRSGDGAFLPAQE